MCMMWATASLRLFKRHTQAYGYFFKYYTDMLNNLSPILLNVKFDVAKVVAIFQTTNPLPTFNTYLTPLE